MRLIRRLIGAAVTATLLGVLPTPQAQAAPETPEQATIRLINAERARHGVAPVREHGGLDKLAAGWSQTMAATDDYRHNPGLYTASINGVQVGAEILTAVQPGDPSGPQQAVQMWIASAPHHEIVLLPSLTLVGVGITCSTVWCYYTADLGTAFSTIPDVIGQPMPQRDASGQWVSPPRAAVITPQPAPPMSRGARTVRR